MDPFVLLLRCGGGDTVHHVVSFHYSPISLRLTRLNQLTAVVGDVQLKAVLLGEGQRTLDKPSQYTLNCENYKYDDYICLHRLAKMQTYRFSWVFYLTDAEVFQGNDASWFLILLVKHGNTADLSWKRYCNIQRLLVCVIYVLMSPNRNLRCQLKKVINS